MVAECQSSTHHFSVKNPVVGARSGSDADCQSANRHPGFDLSPEGSPTRTGLSQDHETWRPGAPDLTGH